MDPSARLPLSSRIALLRAYVGRLGSIEAAAAQLDICPNTLRRNLDRDSATHEALDVISEYLPEGLTI